MAVTDDRRVNRSAALLDRGNLAPPRPGGRRWRVSRGPLLVALALALVPGLVWAHATLARSTPAQRAMLSRPPDRVKLWFSEPLEAKFAALSVWDAKEVEVDQKNSLVAPEDPKALSVGVPTLDPRTYTVKYRVLSVDGHVVEGSFRFTVKPSP